MIDISLYFLTLFSFDQERGILQELKHTNKDVMRVENEEKKTNKIGGEVAEKEARSLDVFWFLKPCTLSS